MQGRKGYLQIGQVLKSNGTDGTVVVRLFEEPPTEPVFIFWDGLPVPYFMEIVSQRGSSKVLARLTDVCSLEDASELESRPLYVREDDAPDDDYEDFRGWSVVDVCSSAEGTVIGTVDDVEDIPGNPCLVVGDNLIPLHEDLLVEINQEDRILRMNLPVGLIQ